MKTPLHSAIENLSDSAIRLSSAGTIDELLRNEPCFQVIAEALGREKQPDRKRKHLKDIENLLPSGGLGKVYFLSFLASVTHEGKYLEQLREILWQEEFSPEQRYFFYWQLVARYGSVWDSTDIYFGILDFCRRQLRFPPQWIEAGERNPNLIVVFTNQLLGALHAPTANCFDYCCILQKQLGKQVILINAAGMPRTMALPYFNPFLANYEEAYSSAGRIVWREQAFDFYQCRKPMPNLPEMRLLVKKILDLRPLIIMNHGHSNLTADLCADFLTVASVPLSSELSRSGGNVFILPREFRPGDHEIMKRLSIGREQVVQIQPAQRVPERVATLSRSQLGLPSGAYIIAIVGNRLDEEITEEFAAELTQMLLSLPTVWLAFIGTFPRYEKLIQEMPVIGKRSLFLGYQKDLMAVYECCDAYLNPPRSGGGISGAFALAAGLPVLTRKGGDVADSVGEQFIFPSLVEVRDFVARALGDPEFRNEWKVRAQSRFAEISKVEDMLTLIVEQTVARCHIRNRARLD